MMPVAAVRVEPGYLARLTTACCFELTKWSMSGRRGAGDDGAGGDGAGGGGGGRGGGGVGEGGGGGNGLGEGGEGGGDGGDGGGTKCCVPQPAFSIDKR